MIYFITDGEYTKVGFTESLDAELRIAQLQTANPRKLELLGTIPGDRQAEKIIHGVLKPLHVRGEWFNLSGHNTRIEDIEFWVQPDPPKWLNKYGIGPWAGHED